MGRGEGNMAQENIFLGAMQIHAVPRLGGRDVQGFKCSTHGLVKALSTKHHHENEQQRALMKSTKWVQLRPKSLSSLPEVPRN